MTNNDREVVRHNPIPTLLPKLRAMGESVPISDLHFEAATHPTTPHPHARHPGVGVCSHTEFNAQGRHTFAHNPTPTFTTRLESHAYHQQQPHRPPTRGLLTVPPRLPRTPSPPSSVARCACVCVWVSAVAEPRHHRDLRPKPPLQERRPAETLSLEFRLFVSHAAGAPGKWNWWDHELTRSAGSPVNGNTLFSSETADSDFLNYPVTRDQRLCVVARLCGINHHTDIECLGHWNHISTNAQNTSTVSQT